MNFVPQNSFRSDLHSQNQSISKGKYNYIAIGSQNEEQYERKRIYGPVDLRKLSFSMQKHRKDSYRSASECLYIFQDHFDERKIFEAQLKVQDLKKQCATLEKMINQMIKQQAELLVDEKKRQRIKNFRKQQTHRKCCPIHNKKQPIVMLKEEIDQIINLKLTDVSVLDSKFVPFQPRQIKNKMAIECNVAQIKYKLKKKIKEKKSNIYKQNQTPIKKKRKVSQNSKSTYKYHSCSNSRTLTSKMNRL